jgi:hypothetical protein
LRQVGGILWVLRFPSPITLTPRYNILLKVVLNIITLTPKILFDNTWWHPFLFEWITTFDIYVFFILPPVKIVHKRKMNIVIIFYANINFASCFIAQYKKSYTNIINDLHHSMRIWYLHLIRENICVFEYLQFWFIFWLFQISILTMLSCLYM